MGEIMKNKEREFAQINQLMVAERSIFADIGVGGEIAKDLGQIIERAQQAAYRSVDMLLVYRNWFIGKRIAEEALKGGLRAEYGKSQMSDLAVALTAKYGKGFDSSNLYKYLAFFKRFPILDTLCPKSGIRLGWSHYRVLLQVEDDEALRWYLDEAAAETWGVRVLQRNISSQYYERMLLSQSKEPVRAEMVKLTADSDIAKYSMLRGNEQLFASKYRLCLLSEAELKAEIEAQKARFVEQHLK